MPFSLFKMLKNPWDQVKIPASEIRFSKTFRFVAQMDAFLVIFHFGQRFGFVLPRESHRDSRKRNLHMVSLNITEFQFSKTRKKSRGFVRDLD